MVKARIAVLPATFARPAGPSRFEGLRAGVEKITQVLLGFDEVDPAMTQLQDAAGAGNFQSLALQ